MNDMQRKRQEARERLKKALLDKKKQQLMARREAYRRSQMDEFRDGMISLVTDPESKRPSKEVKDKGLEKSELPVKKASQKGFKRSNERGNAFKMAKRKKGRAA